MIRFYKTPSLIKRWYKEVVFNTCNKDSIHITFDDGPHPEVTPWVLEELEKVGAKATFFCLGENLEKHIEVAKTSLEKGHQLANHSFSHLNGFKVADQKYLSDISKCDESLKSIGVSSGLFRPPYGRIKKSQIQKLKGRKIIFWSHLAWDFDASLDAEKAIRNLEGAEPGSIITFHDNLKAFKNLKVILPELLQTYRSCGYNLEALS